MESARSTARRDNSGERCDACLVEERAFGAAVITPTVRYSVLRRRSRRAARMPPSLAVVAICSWRWKEVEDEQGNVIVLSTPDIGGRPTAQFEQERVGEVGRGGGRSVEKFFQAGFAELFARGVHGLQDSVGIEHN